MKNHTTKIAPPQSMHALGKEILAYCQSEEVTTQEIDTIVSELEEMKAMLEQYKKINA